MPRRPPELPRSSRHSAKNRATQGRPAQNRAAQHRPAQNHAAQNRAAQPARHAPASRTPKHARPPRQPRWVYTARRVGALIILALIIFGLARACSGPADPNNSANPSGSAAAQPSAQRTPGGGGEGETRASISESPAPEHIEASRPQEMVIPAIDLDAKFDDTDCRVVKGNVDPGGLSKACAYTAPDKPYQLPGTDASDVVVIAGHAAAGVPAVFDKLYNPSQNTHTLKLGDTMYLRTGASGEWWLKYVVTDLHDPMKNALANDPEIWGNAATPGRLLTISCVQPANPFEDSVRNAVIGWRFDSVVHDARD